MARQVLASWGVHRSEDVGAITFHLIEDGIFGKRDEDESRAGARGSRSVADDRAPRSVSDDDRRLEEGGIRVRAAPDDPRQDQDQAGEASQPDAELGA